MTRANIIFGGLGYSKKVLNKFSKIYKKGDNIIVPLTFPCITLGKNYNHYDILDKKIKNYDDVHIHVLSGSCHYLYNFIEKYPENKIKIKSQVFDSPCHVLGARPAFKEMYGIPYKITNNLICTLLKDCVRTSDAFTKKALIPNLPTGIIKSNNDIISPSFAIDKLIKDWEKDCKFLNVLETNSAHLNSFKDYEKKYIHFCNDIYFST